MTARSDVGRSLADVYPQHRVDRVLEELDLERHGDVDAALVAYPHGAAAPVVAAFRERGAKVVDFSADFRIGDRAIYEDWYGEHGAPALLAAGEAVYGLPELTRRARGRRIARREPGLLSRLRRCLRSRRSRGRA